MWRHDVSAVARIPQRDAGGRCAVPKPGVQPRGLRMNESEFAMKKKTPDQAPRSAPPHIHSVTPRNSNTPQGTALRRRAEEIFREKDSPSPEGLKALSSAEIRQTLHELRVHQIELEMQNEELRRAQVELEDARARYFELYDLAPVGYCTISEKEMILEVNLAAANMLGVARSALLKQPICRFIFKEDHNYYYLHRKQLFATGAAQKCELRMVKPDGGQFWAHLEAILAQDAAGAPICRFTFSDVSEYKRAVEALREQGEELRIRNDELTRFNRVAVGRELRMLELKREVNGLCGKLGEAPRYRLAEDEAPPPASKEARA